MKYYISEVDHKNSYREATLIEAKNLAVAKTIAKRMRFFEDSYLYLGTSVDHRNFIIEPVAYWDNEQKRWFNIDQDVIDHRINKAAEEIAEFS